MDMGIAATAAASARKAGKVQIVRKWIRTRYNAFPNVPHTEHSIWKHKRALANRDGPARIAQEVPLTYFPLFKVLINFCSVQNCAISIADCMVIACQMRVNAIRDGLANSATINNVILDVTSMDNVRMELVCV